MSELSQVPITPKEARPSEKISFLDYATKIGLSIAITAGAWFGGRVIGKAIYKTEHAAELGGKIAGIPAGVYQAWKHWSPDKATQERVKELLPEVKATLNPEAFAEEKALQAEISRDLERQERLFTDLVQRQQPASIEPRGNPVEAILGEREASAGLKRF